VPGTVPGVRQEVAEMSDRRRWKLEGVMLYATLLLCALAALLVLGVLPGVR